MTNNIKIEIINGNDISEELVESCYEVENNSGGEPYDKKSFNEIMKYPKNIHFIAYIGDSIIGVLTLNPISKKFGGCSYLINLSVDKNYQRKGIATNLIHKSMKYILASNSNEVLYALEVDKDNQKAINLYKKIGFKINNNYTYDEQYCMIINIETDK